MLSIQNTMLVITATTTALMAGLFFSFSCSVTLGLNKLSDAEYISAMQSINKAILNPIFFIIFFGCLLSLPITTYLNYEKSIPTRFWILLVATMIYFIGVFGVTALGNIPLNNSLEKFDLLHSSKEAIATQRIQFENRWNNLNIIRAISSTLTIIFVIIACLTNDKSNLT